MKFSELMERVRGRGVVVGELRVGGGGPDPEVRGVCEDSRKVKHGDVFVARSGSKKSGAEFVEEALFKGAVAVVTAEEVLFSCAVPYARVADANLACAVLAHEVAGNPTAPPHGMKVIGITGTKGKTTVAYLLRSVLKAAGHRVGMIGTVEIDDGKETVPAEMTTPGSVELVELFCRMRENGVTHCVMEVSSHALHQHRVAGIEFAVGIFTNLTGDHLDYHGTMEAYAAAKAMLFEGLKEGAVAVVNGDDEWVGRMVAGCKAKVVKYHVEVDLKGGNSLRAAERPPDGWSGLVTRMGSEEMWVNIAGPEVYVHNLGRKIPYLMKQATPLVGKHNAYNLTSVYAAAWSLGFRAEELLEGWRVLLLCKGAPGRLQRVETTGTGFSVFVDYAHTHDALENVLTALRTTMKSVAGDSSAGGMLSGHSEPGSECGSSARAAEHGTRCPPEGGTPNLICLFGCGGDRDRTKRPKMARVAEALADKVIVTSDNPRTENAMTIIEEICAGFSTDWKTAGKITVEPDRRAAIRLAIGMARAGDVVLLAGKGHENYQIIGTTKQHFDDVEEAEAALRDFFQHQDTETPRPPSGEGN